ncbi:MAG TPA: UDP-N-acetylglucosamine 1-carboxyvinyltransferase [Candidatus Paceibacterota bacterium]|nr:UDP-N-acetylglucosamine 1-carboxyvinyltransferase [Candidatus Paceibacterota bacterium]
MKFLVNGGKPLKGEIKLAGAKNAATKLLVASMLTDEASVLENFPQIGDAEITFSLCEELGAEIRRDGSTVSVRTPKIKSTSVSSLSRRNRIPILAIGPLLARAGEAEVPTVGGDKIGARPVDIHLEALRNLGAEITISDSFYRASAPKGLHGAELEFRFPSVGATENVLLTSVLAEGRTVVRNAALEPEIIDLIKFLQKMGAIIELGTNRTIRVEGVRRLRGARHRILPDRNEAVSFACLAIATDGDIFVKEAIQEHLITFLNTIRRIGGDYEVGESGIRFFKAGNLRSTDIETGAHPGFMTDWQQPLAIVLTQANGESRIHETIYEDRFGYTRDLNSMGAHIKVTTDCSIVSCRFVGKSPHFAEITGPTPLRGTKLEVPDLRAGMAHLTAALIAEGESEITGIEEIDRGYERIDERLRYLGADIRRIGD